MPGAWDYPDIAELENFIGQLTLQAAERVADQTRTEAAYIEFLSLDRILIIDEWGNGTATFGEDEMHIVLFFTFTGPEDQFDDVTGAVSDEIVNIIRDGDILTPQDLIEGTSNLTFTVADEDRFGETIFNMANAGLDMIFDLTNVEAIDLKVGTPPDEYPRIPIERLLGEEEEVEEEVGVDEETEELPDIDVLSETSPLPESMLIEEPEDVGPDFPEVNENLRPYAVAPDKLEIPAGKETKQIEARDPYNFEIEMALPGIQTSADIFQDTREEIAQEAGAGTLGDTEPVGTYPRTGIYVRNHLKFREPAYSYEIYKGLVYYGGLISSLHDINVKAGHYSSFREYMYVLEQIAERGGPRLIESLTQQQAAAEELETVPDHPSIEGAKAPWLERRQYYTLVEENEDHPAWENAFDYLHGEIEQ